MNYNKLTLMEQHFRSNSHNFNKDANFTIIERIEKFTLDYITVMIEKL